MFNKKGYIGNSMSIRAFIAKTESDYHPKSKWDKNKIIFAIVEFYKIDVAKLSKMSKQFLFDKFFEYKEWHHMGKYFQEVDFYGLNESLSNDDVIAIFEEWEVQKALKKSAVKNPKDPPKIVFGVASWKEFEQVYGTYGKKYWSCSTESAFGYVKNKVFHKLCNNRFSKRVFEFQEKPLIEAKREYKKLKGSLKGFKAYVESL